MERWIGVLGPLVAAAVAFPSVAAAADLYVDAAADPGGDGSEGSPFLEIQDALDQAVAGDVVHVLPGTYAPIATVTDGTGAAPITVVAEPAGEAIVQADGAAMAAHHPFHTIQGLVFDGGYGASDTVDTDGANNLELFDVEIRRSGADCLDLHTVQNVLVANSSIHHCVAAKGDAHGVTGDSVFDVEIRDTEIYLISGDAVQMSPTRAPWDELSLRRCMLWGGPLDEDANGVAMGTVIGDSAVETKVGLDLDGRGSPPTLLVEDTVAFGFGGTSGDQAAMFIEEQVDAQLVGITVYGSAVGLDLRGPALAQVHNAVLYDLGTGIRYATGLTGADVLATTLGGEIGELFVDDGGDPPVDLRIDNLLVLGNSIPDITAEGLGNLVVGPEVFIDAAGHDYHLVEGSAPVDAGIELDEVSRDRDGTVRPVGPAYDVGAYEWSEAEPPGGTGGADSTGGEGGNDGAASEEGVDSNDDAMTATPDSSGTTTGPSAGTGSGLLDGGASASGCDCRMRGPSPAGPLWGLALLGLLARRRRERYQSSR
ncbi:MAG: choice-of-anchor Q domain-containing protein [Myxococcota bacterium]